MEQDLRMGMSVLHIQIFKAVSLTGLLFLFLLLFFYKSSQNILTSKTPHQYCYIKIALANDMDLIKPQVGFRSTKAKLCGLLR